MVEVTGVEHVPSVIHALATASQSLLRAQSMLETSSSDSNAASSPLSGATSGAMLFLKTPMNIQALRDATGKYSSEESGTRMEHCSYRHSYFY